MNRDLEVLVAELEGVLVRGGRSMQRTIFEWQREQEEAPPIKARARLADHGGSVTGAAEAMRRAVRLESCGVLRGADLVEIDGETLSWREVVERSVVEIGGRVERVNP